MFQADEGNLYEGLQCRGGMEIITHAICDAYPLKVKWRGKFPP